MNKGWLSDRKLHCCEPEFSFIIEVAEAASTVNTLCVFGNVQGGREGERVAPPSDLSTCRIFKPNRMQKTLFIIRTYYHTIRTYYHYV